MGMTLKQDEADSLLEKELKKIVLQESRGFRATWADGFKAMVKLGHIVDADDSESGAVEFHLRFLAEADLGEFQAPKGTFVSGIKISVLFPPKEIVTQNGELLWKWPEARAKRFPFSKMLLLRKVVFPDDETIPEMCKGIESLYKTIMLQCELGKLRDRANAVLLLRKLRPQIDTVSSFAEHSDNRHLQVLLRSLEVLVSETKAFESQVTRDSDPGFKHLAARSARLLKKVVEQRKD